MSTDDMKPNWLLKWTQNDVSVMVLTFYFARVILHRRERNRGAIKQKLEVHLWQLLSFSSPYIIVNDPNVPNCIMKKKKFNTFATPETAFNKSA